VCTENRECADGKESDNENGSRDGDGASDDEEVALLQRCCLRLLSLAYHALSVGSLLRLFRRDSRPHLQSLRNPLKFSGFQGDCRLFDGLLLGFHAVW
jgi:hypothetical protein